MSLSIVSVVNETSILAVDASFPKSLSSNVNELISNNSLKVLYALFKLAADMLAYLIISSVRVDLILPVVLGSPVPPESKIALI